MKKFGISLFLTLIMTSLLMGQNEVNPNGYSIFRYQGGQIASEGNLKNGQPDGYWKTYYPNGHLKSVGKRTNFQLDSIWVFFAENNDTTEKISYHSGKKNGWYLRYAAYDDSVRINHVIEKVIYLDDKKQGNAFYYYTTGEIYQLVPYLDGKRQGQGFEFNKNGEIITLLRYNNDLLYDKEYINRYNAQNQKQGVWKTFYEDFTIKSEAFYQNDLLEGIIKFYNERGKIIETKLYKNGVLLNEKAENTENKVEVKTELNADGSLKSKGPYQGNKKVGVHTYFKPTGEIDSAILYSSAGFVSARGMIDTLEQRQGLWLEFDSLGHLTAKGEYRNNLRNGLWTFYNAQNKIIQKGEYRSGKPQGLWKWYFDNGELRREDEYLRGFTEGNSVEYDQNGMLIAQGEYTEGERHNEWLFKVGEAIIVGKYDNGLRDGTWKYFFADSTLKYEGKFVQDEPDGWHLSYYPNEKPKAEEFYIMGRREKEWRYYSEEGILEKSILYHNDEAVKIDGKRIK